MSRLMGISGALIASMMGMSVSSAQVLLDETFDRATIITPGASFGDSIYGLDDEDDRRGRYEDRGPGARPFDPAVEGDGDVVVPRAVVPPATIGNPPVESGPDGAIQVITDTYRVTGESFKDLWSSLQRATLGNGGGVGDAQISFQPKATYEERDGECFAVNVEVDLTAVLTFPEWDTQRGDPEAVAAFARMLGYLRTHEAQHVLIARGFRQDMVDAISELPGQETCLAVQASIENAAAAVNELHTIAQREFDVKERRNSAELFSRVQ